MEGINVEGINKEEKTKKENNKKENSQWRWVVISLTIVLVLASLLIVGGMSYKLGHEHGYNQLEKEIVYALALNKSKHVGKFLVAKLESGGTIIALNELQFSVEMEE